MQSVQRGFDRVHGVWTIQRSSDGDRGAIVGPIGQHWVASFEYKTDFYSIRWTLNLGGALDKGGFIGGGSCNTSSEWMGARGVIFQHQCHSCIEKIGAKCVDGEAWL